MREVRRDSDGELCGYVRSIEGRWQALTVFHGLLADFDDPEDAHGFVVAEGLAALGERWLYRAAPQSDWQTVLIQEAHPGRARLTIGHYSLPGVPVVEVTSTDLALGARLVRARLVDDGADG